MAVVVGGDGGCGGRGWLYMWWEGKLNIFVIGGWEGKFIAVFHGGMWWCGVQGSGFRVAECLRLGA